MVAGKGCEKRERAGRKRKRYYRKVEGREKAEFTEMLCIERYWRGCAVRCARVSEVSP